MKWKSARAEDRSRSKIRTETRSSCLNPRSREVTECSRRRSPRQILNRRQPMTNKESATSFLQMAGSGNVRAAYDKFVAPNFIHHNQYFKGDRQSLLVAMEEASKTHANNAIDVKHTYQDGNIVITHSLVTRQDPQASRIAVV